MSEYFRVLKRLDDEQPATLQIANPPALPQPKGPHPTPVSSSDGQVDRAKPVPPIPTLSGGTGGPFATLYDNLRACTNGRPTRSLVIAGASGGDAISAVSAGLAAHVRRFGLRVLIADLCEVDGRAVLRVRPEESDEPLKDTAPLPLDLRSHAGADAIKSWLKDQANDADMVIIEGDPIEQSIDSAMLACACDGLLIVVRSEVTSKGALHASAERARAVGCSALGIVMLGGNEHLPAWARRLFSQHPRHLATPEDA